MADSYTSTDASTLGTGLVQQAYDRLVEFELRSIPQFRNVADKKPGQQAMPGESVTFQLYNDLAKSSTPLEETVDPDAVAVPSTRSVSVTMEEYGNATVTTRKLRLVSLSDVDPAVANIVAFNMVDSLDDVALEPLRNGDNVVYENAGSRTSSGSTGAVEATDTFKSRDTRFVVAKLRGQNAVPRRGDYYVSYIHPDVSHDLRSETGDAAWRKPHEYSGASMIWAGEIGTYEGSYFIETPRAYHTADGNDPGSGAAEVYRTIVCGRQALAHAEAESPHVVVGPVVDKLNRLRPLGWYSMEGFARYREESLYRIETSSSIAE